jgi:hypothetical protein
MFELNLQWDESLDDVDCPRVSRCTEIARNCTDRDKHNRPTMLEVIRDLDELETSRIPPWSSINQVCDLCTHPLIISTLHVRISY